MSENTDKPTASSAAAIQTLIDMLAWASTRLQESRAWPVDLDGETARRERIDDIMAEVRRTANDARKEAREAVRAHSITIERTRLG